MPSQTTINDPGSDPLVTIRGTNLVRYTCSFRLWKPEDETWPDTGTRDKLIHEVTFNQDHAPTETFPLGSPSDLREAVALTWDIDMIVPGGGGPLHYSVSVEINQDGSPVMDPIWMGEGQLTLAKATSGETSLRVTP